MGNHRNALAAVLSFAILGAAAAAEMDIPLRNWPVPSAASGKGRGVLADIRNLGTFVPVTPCRVADTRGNGFVGAYGPPSLVGGGAARSFSVTGSVCTGIPSGASAFSLNFTVVAPGSTPAGGYLTAFPTGGTQPVVSTLNFTSNSILANAAVVPSLTGAVSVFVNFSTDLIIDINGYFIDSGGTVNTNEWLGVYGSVDGIGLLFANNQSTSTSAGTAAVRGRISEGQDGPSAVLGDQTAATGKNYGVRGNNASLTSQSYGVFGSAGTASWAPVNAYLAGGRFIGNNNGSAGHGLTAEGITTGVIAYRVNSSGVWQTGGIVGSSGSDGLFSYNNISAFGTKSFVEPHALEAGKVVKYVALEGPEAGTYFRGRGRFVNRQAMIEVPEDFRMVTDADGITVHVTPMGPPTSVGVTRVGLDYIVVEGTRDVEFSYIVHGVRKAFKDFTPIQTDDEAFYFTPTSADAKMIPTLPQELRRRLVATGVYNEDGTVNMSTAERMGWAQKWRDEETARAAAVAAKRSQPSSRAEAQGGKQ